MLTRLGVPTTVGVPACVLALVGFGLYSVPRYTSHVADSLRNRVAGRLQAASIKGVVVVPNGRDLALTGTVSSATERATAGHAARSTPGVRSVRNQIAIVEPLSYASSSMALQPVGSETALPLPTAPDGKSLQARIDGLLREGGIEFEKEKAGLSAVSEPLLNEIVQLLRAQPMAGVRVEGHTDNIGQPDFNRALSLARAQAVVDYLVKQGLQSARFKAVGLGPDRPVVPNDTREGRLKNRRVEILTETGANAFGSAGPFHDIEVSGVHTIK